MAKDKDRTLNPAAAQRKAEKQKAVKKGKAQIAAQRTSRLGARNPTRLESQISDLHALRDSQGSLNARDKKHLEELERDVARIKKAREVLWEKAPNFAGQNRGKDGDRGGRGGRGGMGGYGGLGKRRREEEGVSESEETDEEVRKIPWPRDTPPPIPQPRRPHPSSTGPNAIALPGEREGDGEGKPDTTLPARPPGGIGAVASKTTYESKAQVRDLRKEATQAFVPSAVRRKIDSVKGGGRLLEEEELGRLEGQGYAGKERAEEGGEHAKVVDEEEARRLKEEEEAFEREIQMAQGEEGMGVDEDADIDDPEAGREGEEKAEREGDRGSGTKGPALLGLSAYVEEGSDED